MRALHLKYVKFSRIWPLHLNIKSSHLNLGYKELTRMQIKMEIQKVLIHLDPVLYTRIYTYIPCTVPSLYQAVHSSSACNFISLMVSYGYMNL
jgi:hypothetical protein